MGVPMGTATATKVVTEGQNTGPKKASQPKAAWRQDISWKKATIERLAIVNQLKTDPVNKQELVCLLREKEKSLSALKKELKA